jgi:methionyl-tRNA formyltransferase
MKKVLMICCSDVLGIPALLKLKEQNSLLGIAITDKLSSQLGPIFQQAGFQPDEIHHLSKKNLEGELSGLIADFKPDAIFTLTFSWMIPNAILNLLPNRCINFHCGLLPKYKGADPIFWEIRNGEQKGGISVHVMTDEIDNGPILMKEELPIYPGETYGLYSQRLGVLAADVVIKVLNGLDTLEPLPLATGNEPASYLKPPTETDLIIDWEHQTAAEIQYLINAANPRYNGAVTSIRQSKIHLFEVAPADINNPNDEQFPPGTIVHADLVYGLIVACINKQFIKINVAGMQQGYFSGSKLFNMGIKAGERFIW